jgi:broad specificity phosphatase PhoE
MMSVSEISRILHMHPDSVRRLRRIRKLPSRKTILACSHSYTVRQLCAMLEKAPRTVRGMIERGALTAKKVLGRHYIPQDEALKIIKIRS